MLLWARLLFASWNTSELMVSSWELRPPGWREIPAVDLGGELLLAFFFFFLIHPKVLFSIHNLKFYFVFCAFLNDFSFYIPVH